MPDSAPRSTMRPRHPSSRRVAAALPPASPAPTMTTICSLVASMFIVKNPLVTSYRICSFSDMLTSMFGCLPHVKRILLSHEKQGIDDLARSQFNDEKQSECHNRFTVKGQSALRAVMRELSPGSTLSTLSELL